MNDLVLQQKRLPSPDSFLKGRWKVTASIDSHQEAMKRGRIWGRGQATNIYQLLLNESSARKTLLPKFWDCGKEEYQIFWRNMKLYDLEKRVCRAYRVRFGKNLSKAPTPWSPSHLPWLFKQHYLIKVFLAKAGKGGVLRDRRRECPTPWFSSHHLWLVNQNPSALSGLGFMGLRD